MVDNDVVTEIFTRADPMVQIAMHSVCTAWHRSITQCVFDMVASSIGNVLTKITTWLEASELIYVVSGSSSISAVSDIPIPNAKRIFSCALLMRRYSHIYKIHTSRICKYASIGGNIDIIRYITRNYTSGLTLAYVRVMTKHNREVLYDMLPCITRELGAYNVLMAVRCAVEHGGADAVARIKAILTNDVISLITPLSTLLVAASMYVGALRRGDVCLATELHEHDRAQAQSDLQHACKSGNLAMAELVIGWHGADQLTATIIAHACGTRHVDIVKYYMSVYTGTPDYRAWFLRACTYGRIGVIDLLWPNASLDVNAANGGLTRACQSMKHDTIKHLIGLGATACKCCRKSMDDHLIMERWLIADC